MPDADKSDLRKAALARRRSVEDVQGQAFCDVLLTIPEVRRAACLTAYIARSAEPGTAELLTAMQAQGTRVLLPVLRPDMDLEWAPDGPRHASPVYSKLVEPATPSLGVDGIAEADVVVIPALAVDADGIRLGYGGGCYDRALVRARPDAFLVAIVYDEEFRGEDRLPSEPHDRRVDAVVTPSGLHRLR